MSLAIESMLEYLQSRLNIPDTRIQEYRDKSVEEILRAEAAAGNQLAVQLAADMFTNPTLLIELFRLADPENKLVIIRQIPTNELTDLIALLDTKDMLNGLQFFTLEGLMELLKNVPQEELVKVAFQMFSEKEIIQFMPEEQINKLLTSTEMDKGLLLKNLESIPLEYIQQAMSKVTGEPPKEGATIRETIAQISHFGDQAYKDTILNLGINQRRDLTLGITQADNKYYLFFDAEAYTEIFAKKREKDEIIKSMAVIKPEYLQRMMTELPDDLLTVVLTQIDAEQFADNLIHKHPDVLAKLIHG